MNDFLEKIIVQKKQLIKEKEQYYASLLKSIGNEKYTRYGLFRKMISRPGQMNLIAEIKKASPSKGMLREDFDVLEIAKIYTEHKAAAISVLTEEHFFLGKPLYVKKVSDNVNVPVLTKDFIISDGQIYEARFNGASAILLIMAILTDMQAKQLMNKAHSLDLDCLVEVHDEVELDRALKLGAEIIGINNRNLKSFEVDLKVSEKLIPKIPKDKIIVSESGIQNHNDVKFLQELGAHAVLIGETFMREKDIGRKIKEIMTGKD